MNKYQRKIHKQIRNVIKKELQNLDEKYPIIKNNMRSVWHTLEFFNIKSKKHYRYIRNKIKNREE
jgi:hypothetical protein